MLKPLREAWLEVGIEKLDNHEGVMMKALLDSGATGIFVDKKFVEEYSFRLEKLDQPVEVKNVDGTSNSGGNITHELDPIEELYNMYSEEEDTPRIVELGDGDLDFVSDIEGPADPYMDL